MISLSENWVRLLTAMIASDGIIHTIEMESLEQLLEQYTQFPSVILTDILKEMPLQEDDLDKLISKLSLEMSPKDALVRMSLLYNLALVEGPLLEQENVVLNKTIVAFLHPDALPMTLNWLQQQRIADIQMQAILEQYVTN